MNGPCGTCGRCGIVTITGLAAFSSFSRFILMGAWHVCRLPSLKENLSLMEPAVCQYHYMCPDSTTATKWEQIFHIGCCKIVATILPYRYYLDVSFCAMQKMTRYISCRQKPCTAWVFKQFEFMEYWLLIFHICLPLLQ